MTDDRRAERGDAVATIGLYVACVAAALAASALLVRGDGRFVVGREERRSSTAASATRPHRRPMPPVAVPLLLVAVSTQLSATAGLVNIGPGGQLFVSGVRLRT
ncbi:MAG: hypothetical protein R2695_14300 [Acidimicrobiales bacterium]